jgi:hypothetical protein
VGLSLLKERDGHYRGWPVSETIFQIVSDTWVYFDCDGFQTLSTLMPK